MSARFDNDFDRAPVSDPDGWEKLGAEILLDGKYLQVEEARYRTPTRPEGTKWTIAHRKSAIAVVAMTADQRVLMIRQERIAVRRVLWEIVAGQIDDIERAGDGDVIRDTIERELAEEAGYGVAPGGEILPLGYYYTSPGYTDEHIYLFLARPVAPLADGARPDDSEAILEIGLFSIDELRGIIARNEIVDSLTLSAFARLTARGLV
jgi:8-oxo-dGTP pyrophosphatase MutT (NUDIX family)